MRKRICVIWGFALVSGMLLTGCGSSSKESAAAVPSASAEGDSTSVLSAEDGLAENDSTADEDAAPRVAELTAQFGYEGDFFVLHLYENDTAAAIARHVGTSDWNLPIYHYDDFENCEVMQYYDIPSRYDIPSAPEEITEEQAGEVYYSEPNRIILFYHDAEVPAEYTPVGYFDATEAFVDAVENNPVLEGWGNKIVSIRAGE